MREKVDDIVTVSEAQLFDAMRFCGERMKIVIDPTGGLAAAAAFNAIVPVKGLRVGIIISGGNVDLKRYAQLVGG